MNNGLTELLLSIIAALLTFGIAIFITAAKMMISRQDKVSEDFQAHLEASAREHNAIWQTVREHQGQLGEVRGRLGMKVTTEGD